MNMMQLSTISSPSLHGLAKEKRIKSVALSHQSSFLSDKTPVTEGFHWGKLILKIMHQQPIK